MRKTLLLCGTVAAGLAAINAGCSQSGSGSGTIAFEKYECAATYRLENSANEFGGEEDILFSDSVNMLMPSALNGHETATLRDSILKMAFDTVGSNILEVMCAAQHRIVEQFGYPVTKPDSLPQPVMADGFYNVFGSIANLTPELLVYCVNTQEYRPHAAHGMGTSFYINYDLKEGRVLTCADLFDTAKTDSLVMAIQTQADAMEQIIGPTTIDALPGGDNFMVAQSGEIVFVYQPYEVASYAQGNIRVAFYPYELTDYMTPFAIKYFKLGDMGI